MTVITTRFPVAERPLALRAGDVQREEVRPSGLRPIRSGNADEPALAQLLASDAAGLEQEFHNWFGRSGRRYIHTVYPLLTCPMLPAANVIYVLRGADGKRKALEVGATHSDAPSLNRARIRQRAAQLGANEVHVHLLADCEAERLSIAHDLGCVTEVLPIVTLTRTCEPDDQSQPH